MDRYEKAALSAANKMREKLGRPAVDKLYPGIPRDPYACVITMTVYDDDIDPYLHRIRTGMTIRHMPLSSNYHINDEENTVYLGKFAIQFTSRFDKRQYPDLITTKEALPEKLRSRL